MRVLNLSDFNLLDFGNTITLAGAIYTSETETLLLPFPEDAEDIHETDFGGMVVLELGFPEWEILLRQTDELNVLMGPQKAIVRKSQRQIDTNVQWAVFRRDGFKCRYCGEEKPLTVDHVDLWTDGGVSVEANLIAACRRCNKLRGNMKYEPWINGAEYKRVSKKLDPLVDLQNKMVVKTLPELEKLRVAKQRSR